MQSYSESSQINDIIDKAQRIAVLQADNPDGDSMGSALALEQILGDMGKEPILYCGVDIPSYLRYLSGWDRIQKDIPHQFDASIIVDTSADSLFENLAASGQRTMISTKPCIVIDHHAVEATIPFATVICNKETVATSEVIYELAQQLGWPVNHRAKEMIATAIMADSLGLVTEATSARSIHIIGELVEGGVSLADLEHARRELMRKSPALVHYKGELLQRVEYFAGNRIATITIPWKEIERYSPEYNPSMLVIDDMRMTTSAKVAIAFKVYNDGKVTAKIRANQGAPIANELAQAFGGGGHKYASGFKIQDGSKPFNEVKSECITKATALLDKLEQEKQGETLQHANA
ncbi:MAG TPA: DHH family phosphoesterase [Candidatus Saccharimonadales bacterium]|nr:DHH family phosphoesterase [Candidatus Saccharimonadales bacterium]